MDLTRSLRKVLIVRLGSLGDIVHTIPAQQQLVRWQPQAEVHWLAEPLYASLLENVPGLHAVWTADTKKWRRSPAEMPAAAALIGRLRRQGFDCALDFQGLLKSALLARLSVPRVLGFSSESAREAAAARFYTDAVAADDGSKRHVIEINLKLIEALGCPLEKATPLIPLNVPAGEIEYVDRQLEALGVTGPVLINPGAGWVTKLWPAAHYAGLLKRIQRELGLPVVVTYGPGEEQLVRTMRAALPSGSLMTFSTSLLQLAALCRRARLMIAGDTGPLHLAVALGCPSVAVLGPTSPWRNGPFNPADLVVKRYLPCSDSYKRTCDEFICMDIPVEEVFEAVVRRLGN